MKLEKIEKIIITSIYLRIGTSFLYMNRLMKKSWISKKALKIELIYPSSFPGGKMQSSTKWPSLMRVIIRGEISLRGNFWAEILQEEKTPLTDSAPSTRLETTCLT